MRRRRKRKHFDRFPSLREQEKKGADGEERRGQQQQKKRKKEKVNKQEMG